MSIGFVPGERKNVTAFIDFLIIGILGSAVYLIAVQTEAHNIIDRWAEGRRILGLELSVCIVVFAFLGMAFSLFSLRRWNELNHEITEHKRLQKTLEKEITKAQNYLDIAGVMFVVIDKEQKVFLMNDKGCKILGYDKNEIIGKNWFDTFLPERIKQNVKTVFIKLMAGEVRPVEYFENSVLTKSGEERIIAWHNMILRDGRGNITGTLSSGEDITERKYAEKLLRESEECFRSVAQSATDAIISIDSRGVIVFWNTSAERLFGYTIDEAIGSPLDIIIPPRSREAHQKGLSRIASTGESRLIGKTVEVNGLRKDGNEFPVELTLSTWKTDRGTFFTAIGRDITMRKLAEEKLVNQGREIETRSLELSTLYKISSAISRTIDINDLFSSILNTITELDMLKVERKGGIFLIDGEKMKLVSHLGHPKSFLNMHKNMTVNDCLCGLAARTGEIIISKNSHTDCNHTIAYPEMTPHGHIIIPLKAIDKIVGVLYLYLSVDFDIDERTIQTFISIGNQIGIAVNNCQLHEKARMLSLHDPLTKVANRNLMKVELEKSFARAERFGSALSIIMTDLDNFKKCNDSYGHTYGDRLLVEVANILSNDVRKVDLVARYGGEEFLIILPDTELKGAHEVAERIRRSVEAMTAVTLSLGVASYSPEIQNMEALIKQADEALYRAKQEGKNRVEISKSGMHGG